MDWWVIILLQFSVCGCLWLCLCKCVHLCVCMYVCANMCLFLSLFLYQKFENNWEGTQLLYPFLLNYISLIYTCMILCIASQVVLRYTTQVYGSILEHLNVINIVISSLLCIFSSWLKWFGLCSYWYIVIIEKREFKSFFVTLIHSFTWCLEIA